jgi:hypothetical protein
MEANIIEEVKTLETEVKEFANSQPYWAKYLCSEILAGNEITDAIINTSYSYLLETLGLKEATDKAEISISYNPNASDDFKENLYFVSLTNVEGVNPVLFMRALKVTHFRQLDDPLTVFGLGGTIFGSVFTLSA